MYVCSIFIVFKIRYKCIKEVTHLPNEFFKIFLLINQCSWQTIFNPNYSSIICMVSVSFVSLQRKTEQEINNYKERNLTSPI